MMDVCLLAWVVVCHGTALVADPAERSPVLMHRSRDIPEIQRAGVFGLIEFQCRVLKPMVKNPFQDATFTARVTCPSGKPVLVPGFCDDDAGKLYRVRFMPTEAGKHTIKLSFTGPDGSSVSESQFGVSRKRLPGPISVDRRYPHHFVYAKTDRHYFWNGTTTYWLLGVQDEARIAQAIDRLAKLKVNYIRVALNARTHSGQRWYEPQVKNSKDFRFRVDPWPAKNPDSVEAPELDTSRFNLALWQKLDRLVAHAATQGVIVSIVFHLDGLDKGVDPFNGGKAKGQGYSDYRAEERYYRYAVARLAAFSNIMWDLTNEWHLFRDEKWVNHFGELVQAADPFGHLISVHGRGNGTDIKPNS